MVRALLLRLARLIPATAALGSLSLSAALAYFTSVRTLALALIGVAVVIAGLGQRARTRVHERHQGYGRDRELRRLVRADRRLLRFWLPVGALLAVLGLLLDVPLLIPALGLLAASTITYRAYATGADTALKGGDLELPDGSAWVAQSETGERWEQRFGATPKVPLTGRLREVLRTRTPSKEISAYFTLTITTMLCICAAYAGMVLADVGTMLVPQVGASKSSGSSTPGRSGGDEESNEPEVLPRATADEGPPPPPPTYAELCPELPDPQEIGLGLGDLFERDGAVAAGCGERAVEVGETVAMAAGYCGGELRSLAVSGEGKEVLLYGSAAEFAHEAGRMGALRYAEVATPAGGELAMVATAQGTYAFAGPEPSIVVGGATRCAEVRVNPALTRMPPPLGQLWLDLVREQGWAWPDAEATAGGGELVFRDYESDAEVGSASCEGDYACVLAGPAGRRSAEGIATVALADFGPYAP